MQSKRSPILAGILSALVPGLGQIYTGLYYRGVSILLGGLVTLGIVVWYGNPVWYFAPVVIWIWSAFDAARLAAQGRGVSVLIPLLVGLIAAYGIGWEVVEIDFSKASISRAVAIARPMLKPDFIQERREINQVWVEIFVPCLPGKTLSGKNELDGKTVAIDPYCAAVQEPVTVTASGMWPDSDTEIWWEDPNGQDKMINPTENGMLIVRSNAEGVVSATFRVPTTALIAVPDPTLSDPHRVYLRQSRPLGGIELSFVGGETLKGALVTVAMALMATALGTLIAIPISFLAAHNLMKGNPITLAVYFIVRTLLNILRSIESLIIAIIFVVIVGLGPFAGVLALAVHSIAALAKLYSEVIEGIDPGPIEAIRSTGATWTQTVRYGVIPQIVPPFTSFTIYRWDINVRSAVIIGLVGGGGIGFLLIELIRINDFRGVSAVFITIAITVMLLDFVSAKIRERLV